MALPVRWGPNRELGPDGMVLGGLSMSVGDLDRSIAFYAALGFEMSEAFQILPAYAPMLEQAAEFTARAIYMRRDGIPIELVQMVSAPATAPPSAGLGRQLGLAHIRIGTDDLARAEALVKAHGGSVLDDLRTTANGMTYVYATDPDGMRILLSAPAG